MSLLLLLDEDGAPPPPPDYSGISSRRPLGRKEWRQATVLRGPGAPPPPAAAPPARPIVVCAAHQIARQHQARVRGAVWISRNGAATDLSPDADYPWPLRPFGRRFPKRATVLRSLSGGVAAPSAVAPTHPVTVVSAAVANRAVRARVRSGSQLLYTNPKPLIPAIPVVRPGAPTVITSLAVGTASSRRLAFRARTRVTSATGLTVPPPTPTVGPRGGVLMWGGFYWGGTLPGGEVEIPTPTDFALDTVGRSWFELDDSIVSADTFVLDTDGRSFFYGSDGRAMSEFYIKRGDTDPPFSGRCRGSDGRLLNLTGAAVRFKMKTRDDHQLIVDAAMTIVDAPNGAVSYSWATPDTVSVRECIGEVEVTLPTGKVQTFPDPGFVDIHITQDV